MTIEFLLSTMNLKLKDLDKMNITAPCIVVNQCGKVGYREYKNFRIYDTDDIGVSKSRNLALSKSSADIILFCDNDCVYNDGCADEIIKEYVSNPKADLIMFNTKSISRNIKDNISRHRVRFYNYQRYGTARVSAKRESIVKYNISFNFLFGGNCRYLHGQDTLFLNNCLKHQLKLYASTYYIATVDDKSSTWLKNYDEFYFFSEGALFKAISNKFCVLLCLQYLIRHRDVLKSSEYSFWKAFRLMYDGSIDYKKGKCNDAKKKD